jgi:predicted ferric reductase
MFLKRPGKSILALVLCLAAILYLLAKGPLSAWQPQLFVIIAQITALAGTTLFAFSFMIASRARLVEEVFGGLDRAYRFHHQIGAWSFSLLAIHFISMLLGYGANGVSLGFLLTGSTALIAGEIGLGLMAAIALTIIFAKIKYQSFVIAQKFFAVPYCFGAYHLLFVRSDISRYWPLRLFLLIIVGLGLIAWLYREFFYRFLGPHALYAVKSIERKAGDIFEITLTPKEKPLSCGAGQFAYFSFRTGALPSEAHPFSFTSPPCETDLRFSAKALGDYTDLLKQAKPGDEVAVYGPHGKFFSEYDARAENVFIAGGIGVTPFLSILRTPASCANATIFYATKSESDCAFGEEIAALACRPQAFHYHYHGSDQRGLITADIIEKRGGGVNGKTFYLCGPAPMMRSLAKGLLAKKVPKNKIIFESFSY